MNIVNTNDENSFDPTPRLKSSPIPIRFISFNWHDLNCIYCGEEYIGAFCSYQKYCKKCLSDYINDITDNNIYLDVYIYTMDLECNDHEINRTKVPQSIQECCGNCVRIFCFKQIYYKYANHIYISGINFPIEYNKEYNKVIESEKDCKLCGKSLYQVADNKLTLCSDCYLISSGLIESSLFKKQISILYLPWWCNCSDCNICDTRLTFISDCQKYCSSCCIFYVGCRYCLTTNIIFGPTLESQCKKCKRISLIVNNSEYSGLNDLSKDIICDSLYNLDTVKFTNIVNNIDKYFEQNEILNSVFKEIKKRAKPTNWISYSQFKDVKEMTKGGYGIIYKATWYNNKLRKDETVILKRFENSKNIGKYFLNELKSYQHCFKGFGCRIIKIYGFTKDPELEDYILVMKYASEGDLHKYLQKNFTNITWNKRKLQILYQISIGLETIHNKKFMHRDFHSGNILFDSEEISKNHQWNIGDLGLSQAVNNKSSNNEIYGVIPYIAPEIFKGSKFSKEADIYSFGMIMWELTTGCKPFDNVKHDHNLIYKILDGERPKITEDTPECYAKLMKSCWDPDPKKRPLIRDLHITFYHWALRNKDKEIFNQAEAKRKKLIESRKIGPEFAEKRHSEAIYTSRPLSASISKCSSINSSSTMSFDFNYISEPENTNTDTIMISLLPQNLNSTVQYSSTPLDPNKSTELDLDIDTESLSSQNLSSAIQNYKSTELDFDITTESSSSQNLSAANKPSIQNFSTSLKKRRNEVFLNVETHENSGKRTKTSSNYPSIEL